MNDHDLEDRLRRFQPAGPPPELRARVVGATDRPRTSSGRLLEWLPAAVAAGIAIGFYLAGAGARARTDAQFVGAERARATLIDQVSDPMGGDLLAPPPAEAAVGWSIVPAPADLLVDPSVLVTNHD